jgi:hypothetical protein
MAILQEENQNSSEILLVNQSREKHLRPKRVSLQNNLV